MTATAEAPIGAIEGQQDLEGGTVGAPPPEDIVIQGSTQLGLFDAGGKRPTGAKLTIAGLSGIELVHGQAFLKGEYVRFEGVARVEEVAQRDKVNRKENLTVDCVQKHWAFASDLRVLGLVDSGVLEESDAQGALKRAVAALREQGVSDEGIAGIAGLPVGDA